jgi:toxin ParE1/3/4
VAKFKLTHHANADIDAIAEYTLTRHGERQCAVYLDDLETSLQLLARHPDMGRACDEIKPGLRRHEHEHHVVFYMRKPYGIRVLRVLHDRMQPALHGFLDEDEDDAE